MGCVVRPTEYHVRVEPRRIGDFGRAGSVSDSLIEPDEEKRLEEYRVKCEQMVRQIKRHVDDVGSVSVESEMEAVCEHCGSDWSEERDSPHNAGCCEKDAKVCIAEELRATQ